MKGGIEGEIAACKTLDVLLSDFEQPSEYRDSKTQALINRDFVNDGEILIILFWALGMVVG